MANNPFTFGGAHPVDYRYQLATPTLASAQFPSNALDGATANYKVLATASGAILNARWLAQFDAADGFWSVIGAPLIAEVDTFETTTSATYANLTTTGPSITPPFSGSYLVTFGAEAFDGTANAAAWMSVDIGAGASDADGAVIQQSTAVTAVASIARSRVKTLTAGTPVVCKYRVSAGTGSFLNRFLNIQPLRVH